MKKLCLLLLLLAAVSFGQYLDFGWGNGSSSGNGATVISDTSRDATQNKLYLYNGYLFVGDANGHYQSVAGASSGDITSVTAGFGATGGGTTGAVTLAVDTSKIARAQLLRGFLGPNNAIKYDRQGNANICVWIPRFNWDEDNGFNSSTVHPAFVVAGVTKPGFWVAKYKCVLLDSSTKAIYSAGNVTGTSHTYIASVLPGVEPRYNIDFDGARRACANMNNGSTITGWHLMTNAEWAAIALWSKDNATMPLGNNNYGRDVDSKHIVGTIATGSTFGSGTSRWLNGSGGVKTAHNWTEMGVYDLNGNIYEWVDGMKLVNGLIYVAGNANTSPTWAGNSFAAAESTWYNTGKYIKWAGGSATGFTIGSTSRDSVMSTYKSQYFGTTTGADSLLKSLALGPTTSSSSAYGSDYYYALNDGERLPLRAGDWGHSAGAGVFLLVLFNARSVVYSIVGFRCALIE